MCLCWHPIDSRRRAGVGAVEGAAATRLGIVGTAEAEAVAAQDAEMVADELGRQSDAQVAEDAERDLLVAELA